MIEELDMKATTVTCHYNICSCTNNCLQAVPATVPESEGDESEEDESEILEESPCGRWLKRREEVSYRDVPGIDCAYLAMDTEEGVEVGVQVYCSNLYSFARWFGMKLCSQKPKSLKHKKIN